MSTRKLHRISATQDVVNIGLLAVCIEDWICRCRCDRVCKFIDDRIIFFMLSGKIRCIQACICKCMEQLLRTCLSVYRVDRVAVCNLLMCTRKACRYLIGAKLMLCCKCKHYCLIEIHRFCQACIVIKDQFRICDDRKFFAVLIDRYHEVSCLYLGNFCRIGKCDTHTVIWELLVYILDLHPSLCRLCRLLHIL